MNLHWGKEGAVTLGNARKLGGCVATHIVPTSTYRSVCISKGAALPVILLARLVDWNWCCSFRRGRPGFELRTKLHLQLLPILAYQLYRLHFERYFINYLRYV